MQNDSKTSPVKQWGTEGQTLVFLHYFGGSALSWQWVTEILKAEFRCIALNFLGFGGTPVIHKLSLPHYAHAVQTQIKHLGIQDYTLIGHSMGGKIALQIAASHAPGLKRVILIAPSPPTPEPMPPEEKERLLTQHPSRENAITTLDNAVYDSLLPAQQELAIETHVEVQQHAWRWWLLEGMEENIADQMSAIQVPVSVLASKDDPVIPYDTIQQDVIGLIQGAQMITAQDVGHLMPLEKPAFVARQIHQICVEKIVAGART